jgi:NAD(P)-dependent dehydrogenase (short-subunit alcohol dehydrogenase family)
VYSFQNETELFCSYSSRKRVLVHQSTTTLSLQKKNVVVIGGSRGLGRAIVAAAYAEGAQVLAVARKTAELARLAEELTGVQVLALDATSESAPTRVFATLSPDVLIVCAGAIPHAAPLGEQSWEQFSRNWNTDVKISLLFLQAVLTTPLPSGTTIILISSGAAIGGSPLSGGYSGSKRMQMFLASYAQQESDHRSLGLRFLALAPGNIMPETDIGKVAVSAYASSQGVSSQDFIRGMPSRLTPDQVANAVIEFASGPGSREGNVFLISGKGIEALS